MVYQNTVRSAGPFPKAGVDAPGAHMTNYPEGVYEQRISMPDEAVLAMSESEPPVKTMSSWPHCR
jgi:hypothetical protein